jgi:hypothetical protein
VGRSALVAASYTSFLCLSRIRFPQVQIISFRDYIQHTSSTIMDSKDLSTESEKIAVISNMAIEEKSYDHKDMQRLGKKQELKVVMAINPS